jgi:oligosaccharide reducing-end xylanase
MHKSLLALFIIATLPVSFAFAADPDGAAAPATQPVSLDDGKGAFASGKYHNLFVEILGKTQAESDAKVQGAFNKLFHGDPDTEDLLIPAGQNENGPLAYIPDVQHTDVRSEGMSYGMMITVQMNKKADFDAIWNWSRTYMYHDDPKHPSYGFFSWEMNYDGTPISEGAAPDGEEYYAMALLFASNRWGDGKGIYDYKAEALRLLHNMVHREIISGTVNPPGRKVQSPRIPTDPYEMGTVIWKMPAPGTTNPAPATPAFGTTNPATQPGARGRGGFGRRGFRGPRTQTTGKEVNDQYHIICFVPDQGGNGGTDPSYHLPAFYELWGRWGPPEDRDFWLQAAQASRDLFYKAANPQTGLIPNQTSFDGTGRGGFQEDAWRCAMNWSVDWSWFAKDSREQELSDHIQKFFESKGINTYNDWWTLDGTSRRNRHSPGLVATNGAASIAATDPDRRKEFVQALWDEGVPSSDVFRYYDGLLYMMCLMHCSGDFRAIMPTQTPLGVNQ